MTTPATTSFQFASPLLLGLLLVVALLAARSLLSRSGNGQSRSARPATLTYSATGLARDLPRSWRVTFRPVLAAMRLLAIALIVVALARPQIVQGQETIKGEGVDIALALDGLRIVKGLRLPEQGRFKEHYTLVSDTVRIYVERRFGVPALERTTGEIRPDLARTAMTPEVSALLLAFLQESDLVKFSQWTPDVESAQQLLVHGRMIVEATKPEPPAQPAGQPPVNGRPRRAGRRQQPRMEAAA